MYRDPRSIRSTFAAATGRIAFIAFTLAASSSFAEPPADPSATRTSHLNLTDLDLTRAGDLQIARDRIQHMAEKLCDSVRDPLSLSQHQAFLECVEHATAGAAPGLEQLASAQTAKLASVQR
jgi:UrcA family protein